MNVRKDYHIGTTPVFTEYAAHLLIQVLFRYGSLAKGNTCFWRYFSVTEKVIYTFLYYYVIDNRRYIWEKMKFRYGNLAKLLVYIIE